MGISFSNRRRNNHYPQNPPPYYYHPHDPASLLPPPPPPPPQPPQNYVYNYPTNPSFPQAQNPYPVPLPLPMHSPPPPPPPPIHSYYASGSYNSSCGYANPVMGRYNYQYHHLQHQQHPYCVNQATGWPPICPTTVVAPSEPPPTYVDHQSAKKVKNVVNVHKDTLRLEVDERNHDHHLVSFVFDALFDGSITIFYFAKEEASCRFIPQYPEVYMPVRIPFQKGLGQKFRQPSGTGVDLGFFELDDLSNPSAGEDVFPLVISAETSLVPNSANEHPDEPVSNEYAHMQITQAVLDKKNDDTFRVKVIKQILWVDGVRYELREIYGIGSSSAAEDFDGGDAGKDCVICMTEPKDTAALPCRHMCMCSECAKELRLQSNKCPICRHPIEELIEIKINTGGE